MIDLDLFFQYLKGRCHGNQIMLQKSYQRRLIPLAFVALALENEQQYHGIAVHINSTNIGPVTPELTELISERQVQHSKKLAYFVEYLRIYWTDFRNLFTI